VCYLSCRRRAGGAEWRAREAARSGLLRAWCTMAAQGMARCGLPCAYERAFAQFIMSLAEGVQYLVAMGDKADAERALMLQLTKKGYELRLHN